MASDDNDIVEEVDYFYRLYRSGRVERFYDLHGSFYVPPSPQHPSNGVFSKDVTISPHVSARLYLPENISDAQRLPVLVYYHGEYRLAPEVDTTAIYEDCWTALQWVASHADENSLITSTSNKDSWLTNHGDFSKVFLVGDSAGGNLVYHMTMKAGKETLSSKVKVTGSILAYPYFLFSDIDVDEKGFAYKIWVNICPPLESGLLSPIDSPLINPLSQKAPPLSELGCSRILVCGGKKDDIIPLGIVVRFVEGVKESGWDGELEYLEVDSGHVVQIIKPDSEEAKHMMKCYANFIHR
ncbi:hypothetical protein BC332_07009 [Capsicum chinense]|nr:hypothetical protein BC332_07009 [Capsicum chinense]